MTLCFPTKNHSSMLQAAGIWQFVLWVSLPYTWVGPRYALRAVPLHSRYCLGLTLESMNMNDGGAARGEMQLSPGRCQHQHLRYAAVLTGALRLLSTVTYATFICHVIIIALAIYYSSQNILRGFFFGGHRASQELWGLFILR
ncbi:hypothetical protein EI94DRAFT_609267 [Lactarius quietus]|nr:hypothetical protein EI94DRAFT_609267 [Lactarius quietus]